jgi:hypothetical protein
MLSAASTQIVAFTAPLNPPTVEPKPVLPVLGIFPFRAASAVPPGAQWYLGLGTVAPFLVFVGRVSLLLKLKVDVAPLGAFHVIVAVPEDVNGKVNVPSVVPGMPVQPLMAGPPGPDRAALPVNPVQEPENVGGPLASATPGNTTAAANAGAAMTERIVTT